LGKPPAFVLEILSKETARNDQDPVKGKLGAYTEMGVQEYVTFDPRPRKRLALKGYRLVGPGAYVEISPAPEGGLWLETLHLRVTAEPGSTRPARAPRLRFYTADGEPLLHEDEEVAQERAARIAAEREREEAERREVAEKAARQELERRIAELEASMAGLLGSTKPPPEEP
jgi:hypothetical protein